MEEGFSLFILIVISDGLREAFFVSDAEDVHEVEDIRARVFEISE